MVIEMFEPTAVYRKEADGGFYLNTFTLENLILYDCCY